MSDRNKPKRRTVRSIKEKNTPMNKLLNNFGDTTNPTKFSSTPSVSPTDKYSVNDDDESVAASESEAYKKPDVNPQSSPVQTPRPSTSNTNQAFFTQRKTPGETQRNPPVQTKNKTQKIISRTTPEDEPRMLRSRSTSDLLAKEPPGLNRSSSTPNLLNTKLIRRSSAPNLLNKLTTAVSTSSISDLPTTPRSQADIMSIQTTFNDLLKELTQKMDTYINLPNPEDFQNHDTFKEKLKFAYEDVGIFIEEKIQKYREKGMPTVPKEMGEFLINNLRNKIKEIQTKIDALEKKIAGLQNPYQVGENYEQKIIESKIEFLNSIIKTFNKKIINIHGNYLISIGEYNQETKVFDISIFADMQDFNELKPSIYMKDLPVKKKRRNAKQPFIERYKGKIQTSKPAYKYFITIGRMLYPTVGAMATSTELGILISNSSNIYKKHFKHLKNEKPIVLPKVINYIGYSEITKMKMNKKTPLAV